MIPPEPNALPSALAASSGNTARVSERSCRAVVRTAASSGGGSPCGCQLVGQRLEPAAYTGNPVEVRRFGTEMLAGHAQPDAAEALGRRERRFIPHVVADHDGATPLEQRLGGNLDERRAFRVTAGHGFQYLAALAQHQVVGR